ncbi:cadherin-like protein 26 [Toxotes jaculatrix]|uniref:cadherin-like protein 26 n=1 Tax=Toxotes jaculatrix TaxID=941984 RepID=UPI001B3B131F|nr:cadherin-like protein 26 [Toxotes jaculatrix]
MLCLFFLVYYLSSTACSELLSRHRRSWIIDSFTIEEGHSGPFPYELGKINVDRDYLVYFDLHGEGVDEEPKGVLSIQKESGMLFVHRAVDYEEKTKLKLRFEARKTDYSIDTILGLEVSIQDINDNPPQFQNSLYAVSVDEEKTQGSNLLTVVAYDRDQRGTLNSTFHYEIKSVSPKTPDTDFFIDEFGSISFKGCLDHEVAQMFTILVEAKDHGEVVSLSSSATVVIHVQDGNNHLPTISGQTGTGKVKEGETGSSLLRLHVTDSDTPNSPAWRARYTIQGDEGEHLKIETDPDTNDGILTVVKPFNYEEGAQREVSISVENELPYFFCKVKERTPSGLWTVDTSKGDGTDADQPHSVKVIIEVEDTNDPPVFSMTVKEAILEENAPTGTWVEKVTAVDPDTSHARDFEYKVGSDPAGWVTVDPHTGDITTVKTPDRESPHVINGVYTILVLAVDDGEPPMTGTATIQIHVSDKNDNVPQPKEHFLDVCVSDGPTTTNITAFDLDDNPYGGPFSFELLGDVKGKWKLNPSYGYAAGLVKEPGVYAGPYTIDLKISGMQGEFGVYNISVTVCDCSVIANCRTRRGTATRAGSGAVGVAFVSLFLLLFMLLLTVFMSCKKEFAAFETNSSGDTLLTSNTETPGTDCKVPDGVLAVFTDEKHHNASNWQRLSDGKQNMNFSSQQDMEQNFMNQHFPKWDHIRTNQSWQLSDNFSQMARSSFIRNYHHTHQFVDMSTMASSNKKNSSHASEQTDATLLALLNRRLSSLLETEDDLLDYQPHLYAEEGDSYSFSELENVTLSDDDSFQKAIKDLGPKFSQLASICKPPHIKN